MVRDDTDTETISHLPLPFERHEALVDIGSHIGVDVQCKFLDLQLIDQVVNFTFQCICKQNGRLDFPFAETGRAVFVGGYVHSGTHTLTGNLHQTEFAEGQDVVLCTVFLHVLTHAFVQFLAVFGKVHVDKIDNDDSSHIS